MSSALPQGGGGIPGFPDDPPNPSFTVLGVRHTEHAAAPTLRFTLGIEEPAGREVFTIALAAQIHLDPAKRSYDHETRRRLADLFGAPERWAATTRSFLWAKVDALVPTFTAAASFELPVPCTYDHEIAATKYLAGLPDGVAPLSFHFSGSVLYKGEGGRMQVVQIPWAATASYSMPVEAWHAMMRHHNPDGTWMRLHLDTAERLRAHAAREGQPSLDTALNALLAEREGAS